VLATHAPTHAWYGDEPDEPRGAVRRLMARGRQQPLAFALGAIGIAALIFIVADVLTNTLNVTDPPSTNPNNTHANAGVNGGADPSAGDNTADPAGDANANADAGSAVKANPTSPGANDPSIEAQRLAQQDADARTQVQQALTQITGADNASPPDAGEKPPLDLAKMKRIALLVDLSGPAKASLPAVLKAVEQPLASLNASQDVTVVLFAGSRIIEAPPVGWKPATAKQREQMMRWMQTTAEGLAPAEVSEASRAITTAAPYGPDLIWIFSADVAGDRPGQTRRRDLLEILKLLNVDGTMRISGTQLFHDDAQNTLKTIAEEHNGTYSFIAPGSNAVEGARTNGAAGAEGGAPRFDPSAWVDPADAAAPALSVTQLEALVAKLSSQRGVDHADTLEARHQLALAMAQQGKPPQAEALLNTVLKAARRVQGQTHPQTLAIMSSLASLLAQQGKHADAEPHVRQVLAVRRSELGDDAPQTLASMAALADILVAQGKLPDAEALRRAALAAAVRRHGESHPDTAIAKDGLAAVAEARGQLKEAEQLRRESLATWRSLFGEASPGTLERSVALAHFLRTKIGKRQEADDLLDAVADRLHRAGRDELTAAGPVQQSALALAAQGRHHESELLHRRAAALSRRAFGDDDRKTLAWRSALAEPLLRQDKLDDAEQTLDAALADQQRLLGESDPDTLVTLTRLAQLHRTRRQFAEAAALLTRVAEARRRVLGATHEAAIAASVEQAEALEQAGRQAEALAVHEGVLAARASRYGPRDQRTLLSLNTVARLLRKLDRLTDAEAAQLRAVQASIDVLGEDNPATLSAMHALALLHHLQGKWAEAEATYRRELTLRELAQGPNHRDAVAALAGLARVLKHQEAHERAVPVWGRLLGVQRDTLGQDHADTLASMHELALALAGGGEPAEAETLLRHELDLRTRSAGPRDPGTITATHHLALLLERNGKPDEARATLRTAVEGYAILAADDGNAGQPLDPAVLAILREGAEACRRVLGEDDDDTRRCQSLLSQAAASRNG
jgi:hypothetical protein